MENKEQLRPLTPIERQYAEENYYLIMDFMKKSKLDAEEFFDVVIFDFLLSVEKYLNDTELQEKCKFEAVSYMYMKRAVFSYFRKQNAQKRRAEVGADISLGLFSLEDQLFLKANMEEEKGKHIQKIHAN